MYVMGIKCSGHDTGAVLITDRSGKLEISAISEARLNRRKHSYSYPLLSIQYVLDHFSVKSLDDIDLICIDKHGELWPEKNSQFVRNKRQNNEGWHSDFDANKSYLIEQSIKFNSKKVRYINHIDAHAASAYYLSGFPEAAVLTIEGGVGYYRGRENSIQIVDRNGYGSEEYRDGQVVPRARLAWPMQYQNISNLYDLVTKKLGLDKFAAGKTMALAAFKNKVEKVDYLNIPSNRHNGFRTDYTNIIDRLSRDVPCFRPQNRETKDRELLGEFWVNIAREAQEALEADVLYMARLAAAKSKSRNLCLAGGVALSCVTNRKILDLGVFDNVFVQPAASDEGIPLGCALWGYYEILKGQETFRMEHAYFGTPGNESVLPKLLDNWGFNYRLTNTREVASCIANGDIIGVISGGSEYGPRALGNRSILADPRIPNMLEKVNSQIKHREAYRPFAASCHADKQDRYFDLPCSSPFMLMACQVKQNARNIIPSVIHVDGTSRVQSVTNVQNPAYHQLIEDFGELTGVYALLNTSFNDDGEPIVESYDDALLSFVRTGLHKLYIEGYLVDRPQPVVCERIKLELSLAINSRVEESYSRAQFGLCDMDKFRFLERGREIQLKSVLLKYIRGVRRVKLNPKKEYGFVSVIARVINSMADVARHGGNSISICCSIVLLMPIELLLRFRNKK